MLFDLFRKKKDFYGAHLEISVYCNRFPYNILEKLFTKEEQKKFPKGYDISTRSLINILEIDHRFAHKIGLMFYEENLSQEQIFIRTGISINNIEKLIYEFDELIIKNKDAIEKGLINSKIGKAINAEFIDIGLTADEINILNRCLIYNINNFLSYESKANILHELSIYIGLSQANVIVNSIIEKLNKAGYNTVKFDYYGENYQKEEIPNSRISSNKKDISEEEDYVVEFKRKKTTVSELQYEKAERRKIKKNDTKEPLNKFGKKIVYTSDINDILADIGGSFKNDNGKVGVDIKGSNIKSEIKVKVAEYERETPNEVFGYNLVNSIYDIKKEDDISDGTIYCIVKPGATYDLNLQDAESMNSTFETYIHVEGTSSDFVKVSYNKNSGLWEEVSDEVITVFTKDKETRISGDSPFCSARIDHLPENMRIYEPYEKNYSSKEYKYCKNFKKYKMEYKEKCKSCGKDITLQYLVAKDEYSEILVLDWNKSYKCECGKEYRITDFRDLMRSVKLLITKPDTQ